jgi:glutathione synthase/RimK-type ligase-like ATP-grasp enzyme
MKSILLITEEFDPNTDNLIRELLHRGIPYVRWNLDRYPQHSSLTYRATATSFEGAIETDGRLVAFEDTGSVWYRTYRASGFPDRLNSDQREFAAQEAEMALDALPLVTDWRWINEPRHYRQATRKPAQLFAAQRLGFAIPPTEISNDPDKIRAFCYRFGPEIIYKALSQSTNLERGKAIFTGLVTAQALSSLDLIRHTPGIFQKLIPKAYEVRLTVVADRIFAVKILSQEKEKTRIDWRLAPYDLKYQCIELPQDIRYLVTAFMTEFNLVYSCLDFVVTPTGEYVFLESNPGGQYL